MVGHACTDCTSHQEFSERLVIVEQSTKSAHHRLDSVDKHTESVLKLTVSVEHLAKSLADSVIPQQDDHESRLRSVENRPGMVALKWWGIVLGALAAVIVGYGFAELMG